MLLSKEEVERFVEALTFWGKEKIAGDRHAFPFRIFKALYFAVPQPAVEAIIIDEDSRRYMLARRPPNEPYFGPNTLHIMGGVTIPENKGMVSEARWMAANEHGLGDISYAAGPIAVYNWQKGEHYGSPRSELYVLRLKKGGARGGDDVAWFPFGEYPSIDRMVRSPINNRPGEIHLRLLQVFHDWLENPHQPCVDLNESW